MILIILNQLKSLLDSVAVTGILTDPMPTLIFLLFLLSSTFMPRHESEHVSLRHFCDWAVVVFQKDAQAHNIDILHLRDIICTMITQW